MSTIAITTFATAPSRQLRQRHLHAVPTPKKSSSIQLTRRGRFVLLLAAIAAILLMGITLGDSTAATDHVGTPAATQTITVKAGETLWQIAGSANPNGDIRQTVDDIMKLNSLPNAAGLQMGREIAVPVYSE
ncbi:MAG: LysM peptidoglycan-binding domain-containing protein [Kineosporiaceae bacterium]|nr:LysM peptidoglycan-binding domain-containing protein [Aeromicrobium sp.]